MYLKEVCIIINKIKTWEKINVQKEGRIEFKQKEYAQTPTT